MPKRAITLMLILTICLSPLISCGEKPASETLSETTAISAGTQNESNETTLAPDAEPLPDLPDRDFEDYEFRVLNINQDSMWWAIVDFDADAEIGEVVNDAIYKRNANIEDKYNFKITEIAIPNAQLVSSIKKSVKAGSDDYDLVCPTSSDIGGLVSENTFYDLYKLPYVDLDKPWWNGSLNRNFSIGNKLYYTMSDLLLTDDDNVAIVMYNKQLAQSLGIESAEQLYQTVEDGKWTIDKMAELGKHAIRDTNGNAKPDNDDTFGMIIVDWAARALVGASGEAIALKDENDIPYLSCKSERFNNVYEKVRDILSPRDLSAREGKDFTGLTEVMFTTDKGLFCIQVLACVRLYKQMNSDFAVLPLPKYDENQQKYTSYCLWATGVSVPITCNNPERTGIILEALTAESRRLVRPAYYEVAMAAKYLRDDKSFKMLDIILENRLFDISNEVYNWGGFVGVYNDSLYKNTSSFNTLMEKYESKITSTMQKTIDTYAAGN